MTKVEDDSEEEESDETDDDAMKVEMAKAREVRAQDWESSRRIRRSSSGLCFSEEAREARWDAHTVFDDSNR